MAKRSDYLPGVVVRQVCDPLEDRDVLEVFFLEGSEVLTDAVIGELETRGWPRDQLVEWQALGAVYNRRRDSILLAPEFELD
jgi:hypothetical protein